LLPRQPNGEVDTGASTRPTFHTTAGFGEFQKAVVFNFYGFAILLNGALPVVAVLAFDLVHRYLPKIDISELLQIFIGFIL